MSVIYLDTSIISAYFDARTPQRQLVTKNFWELTKDSETLVISPVVFLELEQTPSLVRREEMLSMVESLPLLNPHQRIDKLAEAISLENIVPPAKPEDAQHLAYAIVHGVDFLASWNFRHMVNFRTMDRLPVIAAKNGYFKQLKIVSPNAFTGG
jgi:predicted nucleic acid-binding protein